MSITIELENGELELVATPGHVNLIATDGQDTVELSLHPSAYEELRVGLVEDRDAEVPLDEGVVSFEKVKGALYFEDFDGGELWLMMSPVAREHVAAEMAGVRPLD